MTTRYLSMFLPCLPTDRLRRLDSRSGRAGEADAPLVTVTKVKGAQRLAAVDALALKAGLKPGMALADARAMRPGLDVREAEPQADAERLARLLDWSRRFTPLAAFDGPDGLLLDIAGVTHLFGDEEGLLAAARQGLAAQGLTNRLALADTPEAAWALARFGTVRIAPPLGSPAFERLMAELPVAALRLDGETVRGMAQAGLRRIDDILLRPRAPVTARFGEQVFVRLDGLLGRIRSAITPRFEAPAYVAERRFASGLVHQSGIEAALLPLCRHLCDLLHKTGEGARRIEARFFRVDGVVKAIDVGTSRPLRDAEPMVALFREKLAALGEEGLDTGYGFDLIRLGVSRAEPLPSTQAVLPGTPGEAGTDLGALVDRLGARLGWKRVLRLADEDTHTPEFAMVAQPACGMSLRPSGSAAGWALDDEDPVALPSRPIRLFERPEPIETIAAVPDGPPVRFRWRRIMHEIAAIEGPERIAPTWWTGDTGLTRDYFRAEDRNGRRYWLFREGLLDRETTEARWFLHGLFG